MQQQSKSQDRPLTQAEMAHAVQRGIQLEQSRRAMNKAAGALAIICAFAFAIAATYVFHNDWAQWGAGLFGLFLPFYLLRRRL